MPSVAVIGAGPAGIVAAKYLAQHGFTPTIYEQADAVGGQWRPGADGGVWPRMRTNTSRVLTAFSDADYPEGTAIYPSAEQVGAYLAAYAERFGLTSRARLRTRVDAVRRSATGGGWVVTTLGAGGEAREEAFDRVVVAPGRYRTPATPQVPGLDTFAGAGGVRHTARYRGPEAFRGMRVLVAGCSISALEIASDLATGGAAGVVTAVRRQRYVLPKLVRGVPNDHVAFTRFAALAGEAFPLEAVAASLKAFVVDAGGLPQQYGAQPAADDVLAAGITQSQHYLPLVAEGRIAARPWIRRVDGRHVTFEDGAAEEVDAILFGTGYALDLPFLDAGARAALGAGPAALHDATFHPSLDGLAFVGLYELVGPYFPVLELQARRVAYAWAGLRPLPPAAEMAAGIAAAAARPAGPPQVPMHVMALRMARAAGVEPDPAAWPALTRALHFGPLSPASFRLEGPDADSEAAARVDAAARAFGAMPAAELSAEQLGQLDLLAAVRSGSRSASSERGGR
jgi:cation diffusion facilitator CzcD-associated flavoprotein CzcO